MAQQTESPQTRHTLFEELATYFNVIFYKENYVQVGWQLGGSVVLQGEVGQIFAFFNKKIVLLHFIDKGTPTHVCKTKLSKEDACVLGDQGRPLLQNIKGNMRFRMQVWSLRHFLPTVPRQSRINV